MKLYKDKLYLRLSLLSFFVSLIIYYITSAPTVSFWDCGEFIATSYIMGIPHPPGNPLFVIIGRFFSMLPIAGIISARINLISVFSSAASVFVAYWLILRLATGHREETPVGNARIGLAIGAFAGSLIMGFAYTFWSNAVEAEVYGLAMLLMLTITYLSLLWSQNVGKPGNDRLLILISYLLWISIGIHLTTFLLTIPLAFYLAYIDYKKSNFEHWPIWLVFILFELYVVPLQTQILSMVGIDNHAFELESFFIIMGAAFIASLVMFILTWQKTVESARIWGLTLLILIFGGLGYSNQVYIPIRAAEKPAINENAPSNWPRFKAFLERKQYGQESMITRMFHRRATWENQFLSHPDFGLFQQLTEQFASPNSKLTLYSKKAEGDSQGIDFGVNLWLIYIVLLGVGGMIEAVKRSRPDGLYLVLTMLLCTVGLVFYLNFSDGSRAIAPLAEVRGRDYFYTPGFMYFGILVGVGLSAFLEWLGKRSTQTFNMGQRWQKLLFPVAIVMAIALPINTIKANFAHNDRRGNYLPWDYASNILQSCDKNGIVFTNGDNDTFPLWCIQQVDKVRTDVRVVNLSLLNTPWYIHQLKDQMNVPINLSYDEIENLRPARIEGTNGIWRVQDEMVKEIITNSQANGWNPPVYFAMTVSNDNRLGLNDHFISEGMVYRVVETTGLDRMNTAVGWRIFGNPANFRGLGDPKVKKDDNDIRLTSNYISGMFQLVESYQKQGKIDSALVMAEMAVRLRPPDALWQAQGYLAKMYASMGRYGKVDSLLSTTDKETGEKVGLAVAQDFLANKNYEQAEITLKITLSRYPWSFTGLNNLVMIYYQKGDTASANALISNYRSAYSQDKALMAAVDDMIQRIKGAPTPHSNVEPQ
jgi:hypothetical protein